MNVVAPPRPPEITNKAMWRYFESQFWGQEPYDVRYAVGKVVLGDRVQSLEQRWLDGDHLTKDELELLELVGEDLTLDYDY